MRLKDRIALVTGSSRGIGAEIARRLARDGAKIILHANANAQKVEAVAADIRKAGGEAHIVSGDLATADAPGRIVREAFAVHGALDILVCNAGMPSSGQVVDLDIGKIDQVLSVNLRAMMLSVAEYARLTKSTCGRVVFISSGSASQPAPNVALYAATKAGGEAFIRGAAQELGARGITVNTVAPGPTMSDFIPAGPFVDTVTAWTPLRRLGRPDDIADIVVYLASDEARWLTGVTLLANGGLFTTGANLLNMAPPVK